MANFSGNGLFPSPSVAIPSAGVNGLVQGQHPRIPFPCSSSTATYQFPSPTDVRNTNTGLPDVAGHSSVSPIVGSSANYGYQVHQQAAFHNGMAPTLPSLHPGWYGSPPLLVSSPPMAASYLGSSSYPRGPLPDIVCQSNSASPASHLSPPSAATAQWPSSSGQPMDDIASTDKFPVGGTSRQAQATSPPDHQSRLSFHTKRRADVEESAGPSPKVFVNEERMAARMQGLHLDNNNLTWHPNLEEDTTWFTQQRQQQEQQPASATAAATAAMASTDGQPNNNTETQEEMAPADIEECAGVAPLIRLIARGRRTLPQIQMAKDILLKTEDILPKSILEEISKPKLQVVLWKPPGNFVKEVVKDHKRQESVSEAEMMTSEVQNGVGLCPPDIVLDAVACDNGLTAEMTQGDPFLNRTMSVPRARNEIVAGTMATEQFFNPLEDECDDDMDL